MSFKDLDIAGAVSVFTLLGDVVSYHQQTGVVSTVQAIIDLNTEVFPGGFESNVAERRTEISLLKADAPRIKSGELIVDDGTTYELMDQIKDDGVVVSYTARGQT